MSRVIAMSRKAKVAVALVVIVTVIVILAALSAMQPQEPEETPTRGETIPSDAVKMTPETDLMPPVLHSEEWFDPVPMTGPINTAGAEDSPFVLPDGNTMFFFFTPDVRVPPEKQLLDKVTGIWWSKKVGGNWSEPERIILSDDLALDGAQFIQGSKMWFASVRVGNYNEIDIYTARLVDGEWTDVENAGEQLNVDYDIGEFTITPDGQTLYFHSGSWAEDESMDIWRSEKTTDGWGEPVRVDEVNSAAWEGWPFITPDSSELWFTGESRDGYTGPALFRSEKVGDGWGEPVEIVSQFAGEPTLDEDGNLYFTHHYFDEDMNMTEADIYVCIKKTSRSVAESVAVEAEAPGDLPTPCSAAMVACAERTRI
jgi:hypothetical protein